MQVSAVWGTPLIHNVKLAITHYYWLLDRLAMGPPGQLLTDLLPIGRLLVNDLCQSVGMNE